MKVKLEIIEGHGKGQIYETEEHNTFFVGREVDTKIRDKGKYFKTSKDDKHFSRIHFLIETNPPRCLIRDLDSLNGTFVNDTKLGGKKPGDENNLKELFLHNGDIIKGGRTEIQVTIEIPQVDEDDVGPLSISELHYQPREESEVLLEIRDGKPSDRFTAASKDETPEPLGSKVLDMMSKSVKPTEPKPVKKSAPMSKSVMDLIKCRVCGNPAKDIAFKGDWRDGRISYVCPECQTKLLEKGQFIHGYKIVEEIGEGGMGKVFKGICEKDNREVAIKTIVPDAAMTEKAIQLFLREISVGKELEHPNIVKFFEAGEAGGLLWFAMEYVPGADLWRMVEQEGELPVERSIELTIQSLEALDYAHKKDFVHRDIKPQNILVKKEGGNQYIPKLTDFGLSKNYQQAGCSKMTMTGDVGGTIPFMPPEQLTNFKYVKPACDIYAIGAVLYSLLTGGRYVYKDFYTGKDATLVIMEGKLTPIKHWNPDIPDSLWKTIKKSLLYDPKQRYETAANFAKSLRSHLH